MALLSSFEAPDPGRLADLLRTVPASVPYDRPESLAKVRCPVLVLGNEEDPLHPIAIARTWANRMRHAKFARSHRATATLGTTRRH